MRSEVVPAVVTTFLPARSGKSLYLAFSGLPSCALVSRRVPTSKIPTEKATCCWRSTLLVVEPHSTSTVPFCTSGIRVWEVTRLYLTFRSGLFRSFFRDSTMASWMSWE
ncbi:hypothetical protein D3C81_1842360 [compost metagenome]